MQKYFKFFYLIKILKQYKNNHKKSKHLLSGDLYPKTLNCHQMFADYIIINFYEKVNKIGVKSVFIFIKLNKKLRFESIKYKLDFYRQKLHFNKYLCFNLIKF